jgi:hypothetical protein
MLQLGLCFCGALLYGGMTYLARNDPPIKYAILYGLPTELLLTCMGTAEGPSNNSFSLTLPCVIFVNSIVGAFAFFVVGNCFRLVIKAVQFIIKSFSTKGDYEN